tara:strand:+ start:350 stop:550 length:201 start_codon:yes stop_codon:yes gene_type:complete
MKKGNIMKNLNWLTSIYNNWASQQKEFQGIEILSANEMLFIETLTSYQVNWLNRFIEVWEIADAKQ